MSDVKVELYIKLMDILQEFQLPGGKFDGHGLITALANAKRYEALQSRCEAAEKRLRDIYEVYAGSDGFYPATAPEKYLQRLVKQMADIAAIKEAGHE